MKCEDYQKLTPAAKKKIAFDLLMDATDAKSTGIMQSDRRGQTQGFAFLWISITGKSKYEQGFKRYLKKPDTPAKIFTNYRGDSFAWYFGSQSDLSIMMDWLRW